MAGRFAESVDSDRQPGGVAITLRMSEARLTASPHFLVEPEPNGLAQPAAIGG